MVNWNEEFEWVRDYNHISVNTMLVDSFVAKLKFAPRLEGESLHHLPPGRDATVFPVATLPGCPDNWIREVGSYVVPVETNIGIWFDWRSQNHQDDWNTAVIPSVKGINPITGMKMDGFELHSYSNLCPIHNKSFVHGRICEDCGYEWPPQNYITKMGNFGGTDSDSLMVLFVSSFLQMKRREIYLLRL